MKPQEGMRFEHSRLRDKNGPVVCEVTKADRTIIRYEEVKTGKRRTVDVLAFSGICGKLLVEANPYQNNTITVSFSD